MKSLKTNEHDFNLSKSAHKNKKNHVTWWFGLVNSTFNNLGTDSQNILFKQIR